MDLVAVHPHAYKHGLTEGEIRSVWRNAFEWARRDRADGAVEYVIVGADPRGRLVELVARSVGEDGYIVFHAMTPPSARTLRELGLGGR